MFRFDPDDDQVLKHAERLLLSGVSFLFLLLPKLSDRRKGLVREDKQPQGVSNKTRVRGGENHKVKGHLGEEGSLNEKLQFGIFFLLSVNSDLSTSSLCFPLSLKRLCPCPALPRPVALPR